MYLLLKKVHSKHVYKKKKGVCNMIEVKGSGVPSDLKVSSLCNPMGLPRNGVVKKGDFVCAPEDNTWVYFMKPKNPNQTPKTSHDGTPKFVKSLAEIKSSGCSTLEKYLDIPAAREGIAVRRLNIKNPIEKIWQFC